VASFQYANKKGHLFILNYCNAIILKIKVKASHTHYRALGMELIQVYRQSACRWDGKMSTSQKAVMLCSWGLNAGMVQFAGKTV